MEKNPPVNQKLPEFFPFQTRGMLYSVMHTRAHARTHACMHARTHARTHTRTFWQQLIQLQIEGMFNKFIKDIINSN